MAHHRLQPSNGASAQIDPDSAGFSASPDFAMPGTQVLADPAATLSAGALSPLGYAAGWSANFSVGLNPLTTTWGHVWDDTANGRVMVSSWAGDGYQPSGMMQPATGASAAQGYGAYVVTAQFSSRIPGGFICLWPASNAWPGPELDLVEVAPGGAAYSTVHWKGAGNTDQYKSFALSGVDVTQVHTYELDWRQNMLTMLVDGRSKWSTTSHVPRDYAHGGQNEAFGVGEQPQGYADLQQGDNFITVYGASYHPIV